MPTDLEKKLREAIRLEKERINVRDWHELQACCSMLELDEVLDRVGDLESALQKAKHVVEDPFKMAVAATGKSVEEWLGTWITTMDDSRVTRLFLAWKVCMRALSQSYDTYRGGDNVGN
jgi:hypothetical protein